MTDQRFLAILALCGLGLNACGDPLPSLLDVTGTWSEPHVADGGYYVLKQGAPDASGTYPITGTAYFYTFPTSQVELVGTLKRDALSIASVPGTLYPFTFTGTVRGNVWSGQYTYRDSSGDVTTPFTFERE